MRLKRHHKIGLAGAILISLGAAAVFTGLTYAVEDWCTAREAKFGGNASGGLKWGQHFHEPGLLDCLGIHEVP